MLCRRPSQLGKTAVFLLVTAVGTAQRPQDALVRALAGTHASAVVLDWNSGKVIAADGKQPEGLPGSTIKPLLLDYALKHDIVRAETTVYCRRNLRVGARALPCTHPADQTTFTAETALAESYNTWFAEMGKRFPAQELELALEGAGLRHAPAFHADAEQRELVSLGLAGTTVTAEELARAYRKLLLSDPAPAVVSGLQDSVAFGMANAARVAGVDVIGKTGTVAEPGSARTHGWFAGAVPHRFVVVVSIPDGNGAVAAMLAAKFIAGEMRPR